MASDFRKLKSPAGRGTKRVSDLIINFRKSMEKLQTLKVLEDELGEVLKSGACGESLYYSAHWGEILERAMRAAKERRGWEPNDVRLANYALDLIGIPNQYSEADQDDEGNWIIYWR